MAFMDKITELVAGKATIENREKIALERHHKTKGTERSLKALASVAPEMPPSQADDQHPSISLPKPSAASLGCRSSLITFRTPSSRPPLQRSQSEIPTTSNTDRSIRSTVGPTDISAAVLSDEEIRRNYSTDDLWDPQVQKLPPLLPCTGVGRYRMSVAADTDWQVDNVRQKMAQVTPDFVNQMAEVKLGGAHDVVWHRLATEHGNRSNSFASVTSSNSGSSQALLLDNTKSSTGTRVVRGFVPSLPSSASSSFRDLQAQSRRGSGNSVSSPVSDTSNHTRRHLSNRSIGPAPMSPLSTIKEIHNICEAPTRKIEKACEFGDNGDPDSALASDDDDEAWSDTVESQSHARRPSGLSKMIENHKRKPSITKASQCKTSLQHRKAGPDEHSQEKKANRTSLDRNRTIRAVQPKFRRRYSRGSSNTIAKKSAHLPQGQAAPQNPTEASHTIMESLQIGTTEFEQSEGSDEAHEGIWMKELSRAKSNTPEIIDLQNDKRYSVGKVKHSKTLS